MRTLIFVIAVLFNLSVQAQRVITAGGGVNSVVASGTFTIDNIDNVKDLTLNTNDVFYIKSNKGTYKVQDAAVSGFTTDTIAVIRTANAKFAVLQTNAEMVPFTYWEPVMGTNATIAEQKHNYRKFRNAVKWVELFGGELTLPKGTILMYYIAPSINLAADTHVKIRGAGRKNTIIDIRPDWPTVDAPTGAKFFETSTQHSFTMSDMTIVGNRNYATHERYHCILKFEATNQIKIQDTVNLRPGFWNDIAVGNTIWYRRAFDDNPISLSAVISVIDTTTRVITTTANLNAAVGNNEAGPGVTVYFRFLPTTSSSVVETWGRRAYLNNDLPVFNNNAGQGSFDKKHTILFKDIETTFCIFNKSGSGADMVFENCIIGEAHTIAMFPGEYPNPSKLFIKNSILENSGLSLRGDGTGGFNHSIYAHPNVPILFENSIMRYNKSFGLHCYSGSGNKPSSNSHVNSLFVNSIFENTNNILNWDIPSVFENCRLISSGFNIGNSTTFNNTIVSSVQFNGSYRPVSWGNYIPVVFNNCTVNSATIGGWTGSATNIREVDRRLVTYFNNCTFSDRLPTGPTITEINGTFPRMYVNNALIRATGATSMSVIGSSFPYAEIRNLTVQGITETLHYMATVANYSYKPIHVYDAVIPNIGRTQTHDSGALVESDVNFYKSYITVRTYYGGLLVHSFREGTRTANVTSEFLRAKSSEDTYSFTAATTIKGISVDSLDLRSVGRVQLRLQCLQDSIVFKTYDTDTTSNFVGTFPTMYPGDIITVEFVPIPLGSGRENVSYTAATGNGTLTTFVSGFPNVGNYSYKVIPGTIKITAGVITSNFDNGENLITGTGIRLAKHGYGSSRRVIIFDDPVPNTEPITVSFDRYAVQHSAGYWRRIN